MVRVYLTGAAGTGLSQPNHFESLGNYRSSMRLDDLTVLRSGVLGFTVRIDHAAGRNGVGLGFLRAVTTGSLAWTAPGGTEGPEVTIANGETKVLVDGTDADAFVIVTRISAAALGGTETVQLRYTFNNAITCSEFTDAERQAGTGKYRALDFVNEGAAAITDLRVWYTVHESITHRLAAETPVAGALTDKTGAGETSKPDGLSWSTPATEVGALVLGNFAAGEMIGLWGEHIPVGAVWKGRVSVEWRFTCGGTDYYGEAHGLFRIPNDSLERYELFRGIDAPPNLAGTPFQTSATLPFSTPAGSFLTGHVYTLVTAKRNAHYLITYGDAYTFDFDLGVMPSTPSLVAVTPWTAGLMKVTAAYFAGADDDPATHWLVYVSTDGTDPDPDVDTPVEVAMTGGDGMRQLAYTTTEAVLEDTPVKVLVRSRRKVIVSIDPPEETNTDSDNVTATEGIAEWWGPVRPAAVLSLGELYGVEQAPGAGPDGEVTWIDEDEVLYWKMEEGETQLWADELLIWNIKWQSDALDLSGLFTTFKIAAGVVSGDGGDDAVDLSEWDASSILYLVVNGVRRVKIDVGNTTITWGKVSHITAPSGSRADEPVWRKWAHTCLQVWDKATLDYGTPVSIGSDGDVDSAVPLRFKATQAECL